MDFIGYFIVFYNIVIVLKHVIFGHTWYLKGRRNLFLGRPPYSLSDPKGLTYKVPLYELLLLDNLYSLKAWVTCTSHVHEDTLLKTRQIKVKKKRYKIINLLTHFINEPLYMNFVTVMSPVRQLKKLFSYFLII